MTDNSSLAAIQLRFAPQNYTVTEGGAVNITLVTSTSDYEFDFYVTRQYTDETATGESCTVACICILFCILYTL